MFGWKRCKGFLLGLLAIAGNGWAQSTASVLAQGQWIKIGITQTGVYKLDAAFLSRYSIPVTTLNPRTIRLFGNGGAPLPQLHRQARPQDLTENAIYVVGEDDGQFNAGDAVYFFAQSPHPISYDSTARRLTHRLNPYTDTTYYFLNVGLAPGKRIATSTFTASNPTPITTFDDYQYHELEEINRVQSGREWFERDGFTSAQTTKTISFTIPDIVADSSALVTSSLVGKATAGMSYSLSWGTQVIGQQKIALIEEPDVTLSRFTKQGLLNQQTFRVVPGALTSTVKLTYQSNLASVPNAQGWLNFLALQVQRKLRWYKDTPLLFRSLAAATQPAVQYLIEQADATTLVWDVTNPQEVVQLPVAANGAVTAPGGSLRSLLSFSVAQAMTPQVARAIKNQNLHAQATPDLILITPMAWKAQADRLAEFRRGKTGGGLDVRVVDVQEIYNEFASGQPDPTAVRDFVRYLYLQAPDKLKYLLLFGAATYDYKNNGQWESLSAVLLANKLPTYESRESLDPVTTYCSDDYFGFMGAGEGEWSETQPAPDLLDIGIGRLPVNSIEQATTTVDKLIRYATDAQRIGSWRTAITFVADDGDKGFPNIHQSDADQLARQVATQRSAFEIQKIYLDSYPQVSTADTQAPGVNAAIADALNAGRLIVNYTGHGGETGWAAEQIVRLADILNWKNQRLPLFITATCEFGRYDNPEQVSGAELALLNAQGGGIALLTTARPVYSSTNLLLNSAFYRALDQGTVTHALRLGDLTRQTKNNSISGVANRNFSLLGDPSMQLAYPAAEVSLTQLNGKPIGWQSDTIRALATVQLAGEVTQAGKRLDNFNGQAVIELFDKPDTLTTLGTEGSPPMNYTEYRNPLYRAQVSVQNGRFMAQFVVPKDIKYNVGRGRWTAYAVRTDSLLDATGRYDSLLIGESAVNGLVDTTPPVIQLYVNDTTFRDGGTVTGPDVTIIGKLGDESGITIARNGIGHQLTLQLNDEQPTVVNDYFVAATDDYRRGRVEYTLKNKPAGAYTVRLKAWDAYNNSSEAALKFMISGQPALAVQSVEVAPNPFEEQATFRLQHNRPGEDLEAVLLIADLSGKVITEQTYHCNACSEVWNGLTWNGTTTGGALVKRGLYLYRIILRLRTDGSQAIVKGKLLYIR